MNTPLISIIVASYNQGKYLNDCLQSVSNQSFTDWECIIVDDSSTDDSFLIAKRWEDSDSRFKVIRLDSNQGVSVVRNHGIKVAKGKYFQFLDADDLLEPNKLLNQVPFCIDDLIPVSGNRYFNDSDGPTILRIIGKKEALPEVPITMWDRHDLLQLFKIKNPFVVTAPLFPRSVIDKVGLFNENLKAFEDWEFNFRCALAGFRFHHVGYAEKAQALIRLHARSMTTQRKEMLQKRREFNYALASSKEYQKHFGIDKTNLRKPYIQSFHTFLRSLIPPIFFNIYRMIKN